jgi:hypothetical protein
MCLTVSPSVKNQLTLDWLWYWAFPPGYDYDDCAAFLYSAGADGTVRNTEGHPAKNGLEAGRCSLTSV